MSISLDKKTGINLSKGSKISLEKSGKHLENVFVGLNWGGIPKKVFGITVSTEDVDLDGCVSVFNAEGKEVDTIYYHRLVSVDKAIRHSGDDLQGDSGGDDGRDNEIIQVELSKISPKVEQIVFYLVSYKGHDFGSIPYSKIRIFEGSMREVKEVLATFNLSAEPSFKGATAMVLGKLRRKGNGWDFEAIGQGMRVKDINEAANTIGKSYV